MGAEGFRRRGLTDLPGVEAATLTMDADGSVRCATSFPSQGQGHATTIAQVVADRLGIALQCVRVVPSDTSIAPAGSGTFASRGAVSIGGTVAVAADRVRERLRALAAQQLEAAAADIVLGRRPRSRARLSRARHRGGRAGAAGGLSAARRTASRPRAGPHGHGVLQFSRADVLRRRARGAGGDRPRDGAGGRAALRGGGGLRTRRESNDRRGADSRGGGAGPG